MLIPRHAAGGAEVKRSRAGVGRSPARSATFRLSMRRSGTRSNDLDGRAIFCGLEVEDQAARPGTPGAGVAGSVDSG